MRINTLYIEIKTQTHFIEELFFVVTHSLSGSIPLTPFSKGELI
jgi:hypothetical protein